MDFYTRLKPDRRIEWPLLMATVLEVDPTNTAHHFALSRHFYIGWQSRNEARQVLWSKESANLGPALSSSSTQLHLDSLHSKIQHLKSEIVSLIARDMVLFEQLFALQEAILELKEQYEYSPSSSEASPYDSPCSTLSSVSSNESVCKGTKRSASFVRQHISYPPIARNRCKRIKPSASLHGYQDSYDSGIHTSDQEIFV